MSVNGSSPAVIGIFRIDRFAVEIAIATSDVGRTMPLARMIVGELAPGPWMPANMLGLLAKAAEAADELNERGIFVAEQRRPNGPRLLDALGGAIPESPA